MIYEAMLKLASVLPRVQSSSFIKLIKHLINAIVSIAETSVERMYITVTLLDFDYAKEQLATVI